MDKSRAHLDTTQGCDQKPPLRCGANNWEAEAKLTTSTSGYITGSFKAPYKSWTHIDTTQIDTTHVCDHNHL